MTKTKYEIATDHFEFRMADCLVPLTDAEIMNTYFSCDTRVTSNSLDPVYHESFENEDEAVEYFRRHYGDYGITKLQKSNVGYLLTGRIAWLEANEYDEFDEFFQGGDVIVFSAERFEVEDDE